MSACFLCLLRKCVDTFWAVDNFSLNPVVAAMTAEPKGKKGGKSKGKTKGLVKGKVLAKGKGVAPTEPAKKPTADGINKDEEVAATLPDTPTPATPTSPAVQSPSTLAVVPNEQKTADKGKGNHAEGKGNKGDTRSKGGTVSKGDTGNKGEKGSSDKGNTKGSKGKKGNKGKKGPAATGGSKGDAYTGNKGQGKNDEPGKGKGSGELATPPRQPEVGRFFSSAFIYELFWSGPKHTQQHYSSTSCFEAWYMCYRAACGYIFGITHVCRIYALIYDLRIYVHTEYIVDQSLLPCKTSTINIYLVFSRPPRRSDTSVSMLSDGRGPVPMEPVAVPDQEGRYKRVGTSKWKTKHQKMCFNFQ